MSTPGTAADRTMSGGLMPAGWCGLLCHRLRLFFVVVAFPTPPGRCCVCCHHLRSTATSPSGFLESDPAFRLQDHHHLRLAVARRGPSSGSSPPRHPWRGCAHTLSGTHLMPWPSSARVARTCSRAMAFRSV